jgi:hypothetical protein
MSPRRRTFLAAFATVLLASVPTSVVLAQQVFDGDPVDPNGNPFPMMPGLPLLLPGNDQVFGTSDDVLDGDYTGDVDLVVRVGMVDANSVPAPSGAPGGPALLVSVVGGGSTGQGDETPFTVMVSDGSGSPPYGNVIMLDDLDWRPVTVFAFADLDGDGVVGPTNADTNGAADNAIEEQEAAAYVGRQVDSLQQGRAQGSLGLQIGAPASIGGLTVVLSAGAYTGIDSGSLYSDGPPIVTLWPFFPPLAPSQVIGGTNRAPPDPTIRSEIKFGLENNYLPEPEHPMLGTPFAVPVDGTEPSTDQFIVISGPAFSAGFFDEVDSGTFRATSRVWLRPAPDSAGGDRTLVFPIHHLTLPVDGAASQRSLRLLPVDLFGNVADPNAGFAIDLVAAGGARIVSPDLDDDPNSESVVLSSAAGVDVVIDDAAQTGEGRIDLLQGLRVLGSLPVTLSGAPDSDADGVGDDEDNCRLVFNPSQEDGNQSGLGSCCDGMCVDDPNGESCGECGDPCYDLGGDTDGDTLCDDQDPCKFFLNSLPLVISGFSGIPDECLCGDFDGDGFHSATDVAAINECAAFVRFDCVPERDEVTEPFDGFYSATDVDLVRAVATFVDPAYALKCERRPEATCGGGTGVSCF